jgi:hypothetical protein
LLKPFTSVYISLPMRGIERPVFVLGCGRSGTTIFGTVLSQHPKVTYLNEPRRLWYSCYPQTDIWTSHAAERGGKMLLTEQDVDPARSDKLRRRFKFETLKTGRPVLIEKLPINNFRLRFIHAIFPDARFVHILRNGIEVARSIAKMAPDGWFGDDDYKWKQLTAYAATQPQTAALPAQCQNDFERGLLEWRLSMSAVRGFLAGLPREAYHELNYADFTAAPVEAMRRVLDFLGLPPSNEVDEFARNQVARKSAPATRQDLSERELLVGGDALAA